MVEDDHGTSGHGHHGQGSGPLRHGADQPRATHHDAPAGLTTAANGLVLSPAETVLPPGEEHAWAFRIRAEDGDADAVTSFDEQHGEPLHLVVVRRDLSHFQHLHPSMAPDGTWSQELVLPAAGVYRAFADVSVDGRSTTLGVDLFAPGEMDADVRPDFARTRRTDDFEVTRSPATVAPGVPAALTFDVVRADGSPAHLEPYLEAFGHLVALGEGDLAYLHVHPTGADPDAGRVSFRTTFPTAGRYRLFLQVRPEGDLVTTWFDVSVEGSSAGDQ